MGALRSTAPGNDVVETEEMARKETRQAPRDPDRRVEAPVDVMRVGDEHIIPHPGVMISAPVCRGVELGGGKEPVSRGRKDRAPRSNRNASSRSRSCVV